MITTTQHLAADEMAFGWLLGILVLSILAILTQLFAVKKLLS